MRNLLLLAVAIAPLNDIDPMIALSKARSMVCAVGCRYDSYDTGFYQEGWCACVSWKLYDEVVDRKIMYMPKRPGKEKKETYSMPYNTSW